MRHHVGKVGEAGKTLRNPKTSKTEKHKASILLNKHKKDKH